MNSKSLLFINKLQTDYHFWHRAPSLLLGKYLYGLEESTLYQCIIEKLIMFILLSFIKKAFGTKFIYRSQALAKRQII